MSLPQGWKRFLAVACLLPALPDHAPAALMTCLPVEPETFIEAISWNEETGEASIQHFMEGKVPGKLVQVWQNSFSDALRYTIRVPFVPKWFGVDEAEYTLLEQWDGRFVLESAGYSRVGDELYLISTFESTDFECDPP